MNDPKLAIDKLVGDVIERMVRRRHHRRLRRIGWERALAPMGLRLLDEVVRHARQNGSLPAKPQDEEFATRAPLIKE